MVGRGSCLAVACCVRRGNTNTNNRRSPECLATKQAHGPHPVMIIIMSLLSLLLLLLSPHFCCCCCCIGLIRRRRKPRRRRRIIRYLMVQNLTIFYTLSLCASSYSGRCCLFQGTKGESTETIKRPTSESREEQKDP